MSGHFRSTPWSRAEMKRLGIDTLEIAQRVPSGYSLHVTERRPSGPWYVRLFRIENGQSRELTHFNKTAAGFPDLGHAIEFVLSMAVGHGR